YAHNRTFSLGGYFIRACFEKQLLIPAISRPHSRDPRSVPGIGAQPPNQAFCASGEGLGIRPSFANA
ncbi:hypothetical protein COCVIDRAFT_93836, partial [Bipolaris victoriae FI3]